MSGRSSSYRNRGLTLVEVLVAMSVAGIFSVALYGFYRLHLGVLKAEETRLNLRESSRLAIDFIVRELHLAGARPLRGGACDGFERLTEAEDQRVTLQYDFRGNTSGSPADGCPDDPSERVTYVYDDTGSMLKRATSGGAPQPFINDVPADGFVLRYFDRNGNELTPPLAAEERETVRLIEVFVMTRKVYPSTAPPLESAFSSMVYLPNPSS